MYRQTATVRSSIGRYITTVTSSKFGSMMHEHRNSLDLNGTRPDDAVILYVSIFIPLGAIYLNARR